jgi:hypothetical protein
MTDEERIIVRNLSIFFNAKERYRRKLAIYRAFQVSNLDELSYRTGLSSQKLRDIIGEVFAVLCISSDSCQFKTLLEEKIVIGR